jgi:hypothetical protein
LPLRGRESLIRRRFRAAMRTLPIVTLYPSGMVKFLPAGLERIAALFRNAPASGLASIIAIAGDRRQ